MQQQDSDIEDQQQPSDSLPDTPLQQIDDFGADQVSHSSKSTEEDEDDEDDYGQLFEESHDVPPGREPSDTQDYLRTLPSTSGKATYPMKSKRRVLIVADDDEEGAVREEGKGVHARV